MSETISNDLPYMEIQVDERIKLRQLKQDEASALFELVDNDRPYLGRFLPWVEHCTSVQDSEDFINETLNKRQLGSEYGYGITVDGDPVGHMSLMHINDGQEPEIGCWIASSFAGQGISTSAGRALADFGFNELHLNKIIIKADPQNIGSNRIAEKLGAVLERQEYDPRVGEDRANVWALYNNAA